jgi:FG-GAP repeat
VILVPLVLLTTAFLRPTAAISDAGQQSGDAAKHGVATGDDDGDDKEKKDPCRKALRPGERAEGLRQECENGSSSGIARGDFNGDGIGDLAIGVPFEDIASANGGTIQDAGGVNIIYGSTTGLNSEAGPSDQFLGYAQTNGRAGTALASGDFNGDGFSDLAVGAPFDDVPVDTSAVIPFVISNIADGSSNTIDISETIPPAPAIKVIQDAGRVHIFYGSAAGLDPNSWEALNLGQIPSNVPRAGDEFGASLAWGDFDGDDVGDLAVGIPGHNLQAGAVGVLYGPFFGNRLNQRRQLWTQNSTGIQDTAEAGDRFGATLAGGEFGISSAASDLAVGVPGEDLTITVFVGRVQTTRNVRDAGAVHVLYGADTNALTATGAQFWNQASRQVEGGGDIQDAPEDDDRFGSALASFGLGGSDLAIGVPGEDVGTITDAGAVNVIYYSPGANQLAFTNNQIWTQDSPDIEEVAESGDSFGFALAGGDFNGDTLKDLAIGAPGETLNDQSTPLSNAGAVHVLYYQSFGVGLSAAAGPGDQVWTQDITDIADKADTGERFGSSLTAWDFGNGFLADLAIGVPFQAVGGFAGAGAVNVIYGDNTAFIAALRAIGNQFWTQDSANIEGVAEAGDQFGRTVY